MAYRPAPKRYTVVHRKFNDERTYRDPRVKDASHRALDLRDLIFESDGAVQCAWVEVEEPGKKRERYGQVRKRLTEPYHRGDYLKEIEKA